VTQTLRNAVLHGKVAHAYLFTGPRGTGKTSIARILARAVNCLQPRDGEPCNVCAICVSMLERRSLDLVEIDGASNNSVDDVRELRERVNFRPAEARRKVFIIDEVHMLSIGAFNALLKTLEEPPDHVLFALATTEVHKVPATVASRCQRLDLRPIPLAEMVARLRFVCEREGLQADDAVLEFVAGQSTGSLRDALSLLEQIRAYCGDSLQLAEVESAVGVARIAEVANLADAMAAGDLPSALLVIGQLVDNGIDPRQLARQLSGYWRDALLSRAQRKPVAQPHVARCVADQIVAVLRSLLGVESATRRSDSPRFALELAIAEATLALGQGSSAAQSTATPRSTVAEPLVSYVPPEQPHAPDMPIPAPTTAAPPLHIASYEPAPTQVEQPAHAPLQAAAIEQEPAHQSPASQMTQATPPTEAARTSDGAEEVREKWPLVLRRLHEQGKVSIDKLLQKAISGALVARDDVVSIAFLPGDKFMRDQLERAPNRQLLEQAVRDVYGGHWGVRCVTIEAAPSSPAGEGRGRDYLDELANQVDGSYGQRGA
jgi:DNA polymerase-3 subunit gamma/tau